MIRHCLPFAFLVAACTSTPGPSERLVEQFPDLAGSADESLLGDGPLVDLAGPADLLPAQSPNGPSIAVLSPGQDSEVPYDTLRVTAQIMAGNGGAIDASTVEVRLASGAAAPLSLTASADTYVGQIDIGAVPSASTPWGSSTFWVVARDVSGNWGVSAVPFRHDHGPRITFLAPTRSTAKGSFNVTLRVEDQLHPLTDASGIVVTIRSAGDVQVAPVAGPSPLQVGGTVNANAFNPPLDGPIVVRVAATNSNQTVGRASFAIDIDNLGPTLEILEPQAGKVIGGVTRIRARVVDSAGIDESSVVAVVGGSTIVPLVRLSAGGGVVDGGSDGGADAGTAGAGDEFAATFDLRQLGTGFVFPTLSVRADDLFGNHAERAEEIVIDNVGPRVALDPPAMRLGKVASSGKFECSALFDPVGSDAASDGDTVRQLVTLRARIEDSSNTASGLVAQRVALVDPAAVTLFALPAANAPLVVDTDGDGQCDDVNPLLVPTANVQTANQALALALGPITPAGEGNFCPAGPATPPWNTLCDQFGDDPNDGGVCLAPRLLAPWTTMTFAKFYTAANEPAIWTIPPVSISEPVGFQLDTLNRLPEGPTCVAVRALDHVGNRGVSAPLRVCIDRGGGLCGSWAIPDCTGTYSKSTQSVSSVACTATNPFPSPQVLRVD